MREAQQQKPKNAGRIPPFWIRPEDHRGQPIDSRLVEASQRLWPWAYRYIERELQDLWAGFIAVGETAQPVTH